jgi:hypothetical protein
MMYNIHESKPTGDRRLTSYSRKTAGRLSENNIDDVDNSILSRNGLRLTNIKFETAPFKLASQHSNKSMLY